MLRNGAELTFTGSADAMRVWMVVAIRQFTPALGSVLLLVLLRLLTRRQSIAIVLGMAVMFFGWTTPVGAPVLWLALLTEWLAVALFMFVMIRFGLLAALTALFVFNVCQVMPLTLAAGHWSATGSNQTIAMIIALTLFAFYASRAGQPLLGKVMADG